jgi:catalase
MKQYTYLHLSILFLGFITLLQGGCSSESPSSIHEVFYNDESEQAEIAVVNFRKLLDNYKTDYISRGAHAKAHACVKALFKISNDIEQKYRHGIFSKVGKQFKAWIRFSNGHFDLSISHDSKPDARGMAIKILEPPGDPLQVAANGIPTQDILLTNSPVFFIENIYDYNKLVAKPDDLIGFIFNGLNPFKWRIRELILAKKTLTPPPSSMLSPQYFSITAYKLGPHNIKYSVKPCQHRPEPVNTDSDDPDYLREDLAHKLEKDSACFNFMIQQQNPEKYMSIEDPTKEWKETDSPFITLAQISIPAQTFNKPEQYQFCENLSFAPWHALAEHRPIGQFNRLRKAVYPASSVYRHTQNHTEVPVSLDW